MMLNFISNLWKAAPGGPSQDPDLNPFPTAPLLAGTDEPLSDDPEFPGRTKSEVRRLKQQRETLDRERDRLIEANREEAEGTERLMFLSLAAEDQRRIMAQITVDVADARLAIGRVHDAAVLRETSAREALEAARGRAVLLPDGRLVFFTADGSALYGEDDRQITDSRTISDALQQHSPTATTYEEFTGYSAACRHAAEEARRLHDVLEALDGIETRLAKDQLSAAEVQALNDEMKAIINALPAAAREEYDHIRVARDSQLSPAYLPADPAFETAPLLHAEFQKAVSGIGNAAENTTKPDHQLPTAYIAVPDF